jgi:uncharacterized protein (DUF1697 family)
MRYNPLMPTYIALLRGINVGGNKKVSMADLKKALEKAGYSNVKTLLNSGNVVLDADENKPAVVRKDLEALLEKTFKFPVPVLVRTYEELEALEASKPFKGIPVTKDTRLYITFLSDGSKPKGGIKIPYRSPDADFRILSASKREVISVFVLSPGINTPKAMEALEKEWGKDVTTRNWNTVQKLLALKS